MNATQRKPTSTHGNMCSMVHDDAGGSSGGVERQHCLDGHVHGRDLCNDSGSSHRFSGSWPRVRSEALVEGVRWIGSGIGALSGHYEGVVSRDNGTG